MVGHAGRRAVAPNIKEEQAMMAHSYFRPEASATCLSHEAGAKVRAWISRSLGFFRAGVAKVDRAHALRCELASLPENTLRDTGITPEDASGIAGWQPALPFFMQNSFGRH